MDGLEIAATTMCSAYDCPVCESPKYALEKKDVSYSRRSGAKVKALVGAASGARWQH